MVVGGGCVGGEMVGGDLGGRWRVVTREGELICLNHIPGNDDALVLCDTGAAVAQW